MTEREYLDSIEIPKGFMWFDDNSNWNRRDVLVYKPKWNVVLILGVAFGTSGVINLIVFGILAEMSLMPYSALISMIPLAFIGLFLIVIGLCMLSRSKLYITVDKSDLILEIGASYTGKGTTFVRDPHKTVIKTEQSVVKLGRKPSSNWDSVYARNIFLSSSDKSKSVMICENATPERVEDVKNLMNALLQMPLKDK